MRLCVLGNSHVASLKSGWDAISGDYPDVSITFFAARQRALDGLHLQEGKLVPQTDILAKNIAFTSGGLTQVDLQSYDAFLCYALGLPTPVLDPRYSSAVTKLIFSDVFSRSLNIKIARLIRRGTTKPLYIAPNPRVADTPHTPKPGLTKQLDYRATIALMQRELNLDRSKIIPQPPETLTPGGFTLGRFSIGSIRLDVGDAISGEVHPASDIEHMNRDFGTIWIRNFLKQIN